MFSENRRITLGSVLTVLLTIGQVISICTPVSALGTPDLSSTVFKSLVNESSVSLAPGINEKRFTYVDSSGNRVENFEVDVDTTNPNTAIMAGTPDDGTAYKMQTVREQANAAIKNGKNVIAAVNASGYDMATGEPMGYVIKDGVQIHEDDTEYYFFGILKDGTPIIGDVNKYKEVKDNLQQAMGSICYLVKDGKIVDCSRYPYIDPRTAVGIRKDNSVFFVCIDGRQNPYSSGILMSDLAQLMYDMGAVQALNLDGGGSTTYLSRTPGTDSLELKNKPSDVNERAVANSWLIVSKAVPDHAFASAYITPFDKTYTPNSSVAFTAYGRDATGASASLPTSGLSWRLSDTSFGSIDANGVFQSNGKQGQVQVKLSYNGNVVGSAYVEIAVPDDIHFTNESLSLDVGAVEPLGLVTRYQGRDVITHSGDINWNITPESLGTIGDSDIFHAASSSVSGTVYATISGTDLSASISLKVGQLPVVLYNFEDGLDDWVASVVGRGESCSISQGAYPNDPVRFGNHSLKIDYDFTQAKTGTTLGCYAGPTTKTTIPGMPTGVGMWVYATSAAKGYWIRMNIYDGSGRTQTVNLTSETIGVDWTGWKYCEAEIPSSYVGPFSTYPKQMVRIMSTKSGLTGGGPMTKGSLYIDNVRAVYGTTNDDLYPPVVDSINVDGQTFTTSAVNITASIHDDTSDIYATGINWDRAKIIVDGVDYSTDANHFSYDKDGSVSLAGCEWTEGVHEVKIDIQDNFGNETVKTGYFTVNTGSGAKVELTAGSDTAPLGGKFKLNIATDNSADIKGITAQVSVGKNFPVSGVQFSQTVTGSTYAYDADQGIVTLSLTNNSTLTSDNLATIDVSVPNSTASGSLINYYVISSSIQYNSAKDSNLNPTFSSKQMSAPVTAAYQLTVKSLLVGKDGVVLVTDNSGNPAANVSVNMSAGGAATVLGQTGANGMVTSPAMTDTVKKFTLYAVDQDGLCSFTVTTQSYPPLTDAAPSDLLAGATTDPKTEKAFSWITNPLFAGNTPQMQYVAQSVYAASGDTAWQTVQGQYVDQTFSGNQDITQNGVARLNSVTATGLKPGTTYAYRVGDGANWSDVRQFTTESDNKNNFRFDMFGDTQSVNLAGLSDFNTILGTIESGPVQPEFSVHVGDFIDDASLFYEWDEIASTLNSHPAFDSLDMVHVIGNHDYMGDPNGVVAKALFNTPQNGPQSELGAVYSTDYNNIHIDVISYTTDSTLMQQELDWLRTDVKNSNKTWKVVVTHQPMYNTNPDDGVTIFNTMARPVMDELGIDLVISGHDHAYARSKQLKNGVESPDGTTYLEIGTTGPKHYTATNDGSFVTVNDSNFAMYVTADVSGGAMSITAKQADENVIDQFTLAKTETGAISGTVSDNKGNPIAGADVGLTVSGRVYSAATASDGTYAITNVPTGTGYTVTASKTGYNNGGVTGVAVTANTTTSDVNITMTASGAPSAPAITPSGGTYTSPQVVTVSISAALSVGQAVYYTTNGNSPTVAGAVYYSAPFPLTLSAGAAKTVQAAVYDAGTELWSSVASATFTVNAGAPAAPAITPIGGTYTSPQVVTVSISAALSVGQAVYYTTNGNSPTVAGAVYYSAPFPLTLSAGAAKTVQAAVYDAGTGLWSSVASATFTVNAATVPVAGMTVSGQGGATSVASGSTLQMLATVLPANATNKSVTWSVTNGSGAATINKSSGLLTGGNVGTVTVTATAADGSGVTGTAQITVTSGSGGANNPSGSGATAPAGPPTTNNATITPATGGTLSLGNNVKLDIPPGALQGSTGDVVAVRQVDNPPAAPSGFQVLGCVYEFTVGGSTSYSFSKPVTLTFTFDPVSLPAGQTPAVYYYDSASSQWVSLGGAVSGNTITVTVNHFTKYAVMAKQAAPPPVPAQVFSDITGSFWASDAINTLSSHGYISGYPDGAFKPANSITRAEFVSIMNRVLKLQAYDPAAPDFSDISPAGWFYRSVESAVYAGIVKGYGSAFKPNNPITREELATILVNALGKQEEAMASASEKTGLSDNASISAWARGSVAVAVKHGLLKGYPDGSFRPQGDATRAEACAMISNFLGMYK